MYNVHGLALTTFRRTFDHNGEGESARPPPFTLSNPLTQVLSPSSLSPSCPFLLLPGSNDRPCTQGARKGERVGLVQPVQVRDQYSTVTVMNRI